MEPRADLSWRVGECALPVYLPITGRGIRILVVHAGMVSDCCGACPALCTWLSLVSVALRFAFPRDSALRTDLPSLNKFVTSLLSSLSKVPLWLGQIANRDSVASFAPAYSAASWTAAFRSHFLET